MKEADPEVGIEEEIDPEAEAGIEEERDPEVKRENMADQDPEVETGKEDLEVEAEIEDVREVEAMTEG